MLFRSEVAKMHKLLKQLTTTKILKEPTFICELLDQISCAEKSLQSTTPPTLFNNTPCRMVEKTKEHILNTITSFWSEKALDNQIRNQKQLLELRTTEDDDDDEKYDINEFIDGLSKLKEKLYPIQRPDAAPPCAAASSL